MKICRKLFLLFIPTLLFAAENTETAVPEIGIVERLDTYIPGNIILTDEEGNKTTTGDLIGKPTVLVLAYYRCPGICTPLMDGLADVIKKTDLVVGKDYQVLTVSFNPREGTDLAKQKKKNYLEYTGLEEAKSGWKFFTADSQNISQLTNSVGFYYKQTGNNYLHTGTLIFLSGDGKITRYLNGVRFLPFEFKMALVETSKGQSGPTLNKVLQYCYTYDPAGQQYVLNITRVAGIIITFILLLFFISLVTISLIKKQYKTANNKA